MLNLGILVQTCLGGEDVNDRIFNGLEKEIPVFPDPDRT